jgi:hypothetical protein
MPFKHSKPALVQCKATTSSGGRCKAKPHKDNLCFFHSDPKKAAELGRKGGRANRHTYGALEEVVAPESVGDVKRMLAQTMADVIAGKTDPKLGTTVAYMAVALLRTYEAEPPAPAERPSIYTALQFRTAPCEKELGYEIFDVNTALPPACGTTLNGIRSAGAHQQDGELSPAPAEAMSAQSEKAEVARHKQVEDFEILDYESPPRRKC